MATVPVERREFRDDRDRTHLRAIDGGLRTPDAARSAEPLRSAGVHDRAGAHDVDGQESVLDRLTHLVRLTIELGIAETREIVITAVVSIGVAAGAAIALTAALVVLIAGALAPVFDAAWQHLVIAGGVTALLAIAAIAWSVMRLRRLSWPRETLASFEETWRWLAAQTRSRLTLQ